MDITDMILGAGLAVIGYFTKRTIDKADIAEQLATKNKTEIELVKQENVLKHGFTGAQFNKLEQAMKDLTNEIKELNTRLTEK